MDGFLSFMEEIRDYQFNNDVIIRSIYGHIDRSIRDYMGTTLRDLFPHKYTDEGPTFSSSGVYSSTGYGSF